MSGTNNTPLRLDRDEIKEFFETGDIPTEEQYINTLDSLIVQRTDEIFVDCDNQNVGVGTDDPKKKLHVQGEVFVGSFPGESPEAGDDSKISISAGGQSGINLKTNSSDAMRFVDSNANSPNPHPFTFVDNTGRGFRFYKHIHNGPSEEHLRINPNGQVGIDSNNPKAKLQLGDRWTFHDGSSKIIGVNQHIDGTAKRIKSGTANALQMDGQGNVRISAAPTGPAGSAITWNHGFSMLNNGDVGINEVAPTNRLEVFNGPDRVPIANNQVNPGGNPIGPSGGPGARPEFDASRPGNIPMRANDTGLKLPTGAGNGKVLVSDADGNAFWRDKSTVTNGLWQTNGTNIHNGNSSGNVGINNNAPTEKLHVNGNIRMQEGHDFFFRGGNDTNHGIGVYHSRDFKPGHRVNGPVLYGYLGGMLGTNTGGNKKVALRWDEHERVGINGLTHPSAGSHRFQVFGNERVPLFVETDNNDAIHFNDRKNGGSYNPNPFTFVDGTGERGFQFYSNHPSRPKTLFSVDNQKAVFNTGVIINNNVRVDNNKAPFVWRRYYCGEISVGKRCYETVADYGAAVIAGFWADGKGNNPQSSNTFNIDTTDSHVRLRMENNGTHWYVRGDIHSRRNHHELWTVDVLFIRTEFSNSLSGIHDISGRNL